MLCYKLVGSIISVNLHKMGDFIIVPIFQMRKWRILTHQPFFRSSDGSEWQIVICTRESMFVTHILKQNTLFLPYVLIITEYSIYYCVIRMCIHVYVYMYVYRCLCIYISLKVLECLFRICYRKYSKFASSIMLPDIHWFTHEFRKCVQRPP